jgi:hypothetical protein
MPIESVAELALHAKLMLAVPYVLEWLKKSKYFPWLTQETKVLNRWVSGCAALVTTLGISYTYSADAGQLIITGLTVSGVLHGMLEWLGQFAAQQFIYDSAIAPTMTTAVRTPQGSGD